MGGTSDRTEGGRVSERRVGGVSDRTEGGRGE